MPPRPRLYATLAELPPQKPRMNSAILPRLNGPYSLSLFPPRSSCTHHRSPLLNAVLGSELQPAPVGLGPTTGFFRSVLLPSSARSAAHSLYARNNYCDASPMDPASHTGPFTT